MINRVYLIPGGGHWGTGTYERGPSIGLFSELDVVDQYLPHIIDQLELAGIHYEVLNTRSTPGLNKEEMKALYDAKSLVLWLSCGWFHKTRVRNGSFVHFHATSKNSQKVAFELLDALQEWGTCSAFGHVKNAPKPSSDDFLLGQNDSVCLKVEPFVLNGPNYEDYLRRLRPLGDEIGRFVSDLILTHNPSAGYKPQQYLKGTKTF